MKVAICFFGLNRSLSITAPSINISVYQQLQKAGIEYDVYAALMFPKSGINNQRSGEVACVPEVDSLTALQTKNLVLVDQDEFDHNTDLVSLGLVETNDAYHDGHASSRNQLRELHSINLSYNLAVQSGQHYDAFIFLRPDLYYHEPFNFLAYLGGNSAVDPSSFITPAWQQWFGLNDRMAICGTRAASVYASRLSYVPRFLSMTQEALHAERMLLFVAIDNALHYTQFSNERASRVRANGEFAEEQFILNQLSAEAVSKYNALRQGLNTPVLILGFNRADKLLRVIDVLRQVRPKKIYAGMDGPRHEKDQIRCAEARSALLAAIDWECEVHVLAREKNLGCRKAVSHAVSWFFSHEEEGIIVEDDVVPDVTFFHYAAELLERYRGHPQVGIISGDNFGGFPPEGDSYYFSRYFHCWGWATWRDKWAVYDDNVEQDDDYFSSQTFMAHMQLNPLYARQWLSVRQSLLQNAVDSWALRMNFSLLRAGMLCVTPAKNLCVNIGFGEDSTHCVNKPHWFDQHVLMSLPLPLVHPEEVRPNAGSDQDEMQNLYLVPPCVTCVQCGELAIELPHSEQPRNKLRNTTYHCAHCGKMMRLDH